MPSFILLPFKENYEVLKLSTTDNLNQRSGRRQTTKTAQQQPRFLNSQCDTDTLHVRVHVIHRRWIFDDDKPRQR